MSFRFPTLTALIEKEEWKNTYKENKKKGKQQILIDVIYCCFGMDKAKTEAI
jgi:hypothetical protein